MSGTELLAADHAVAKRLRAVALDLFSRLHRAPFAVVILNVALRLPPPAAAPASRSATTSIARFVQPPATSPGPAGAGAGGPGPRAPGPAMVPPRSPGGSGYKVSVAGTGLRPVDEYYSTSRLSFIGTWKRRFKAFMRRLRVALPTDPDFRREVAGVERTATRTQYLHLDVDAFFCSLAARGTPEVEGQPLAVVSGLSDTSEVCSASYAARAFGLRANMFVKEARARCPGILDLVYVLCMCAVPVCCACVLCL